jgi:hypothetical protein
LDISGVVRMRYEREARLARSTSCLLAVGYRW